MLEFKTEMSAVKVTNLHPKLPITSKPKHTSSTTARLTPVDVPIFSDIRAPLATSCGSCDARSQVSFPTAFLLQ